jgi:hypothetical protein
MQSSVASFPANAADEVSSRTKAASLPWFVYAVVLGAACIPMGALWDISWHSTIGRDSFWTPAHMLIYLGGALPGFACGWLVFKTSFLATEAERAASVSYFGFRGPLGAWVTIWGAMTMLVSAPFDNWWHDAYGLDVEILSPPHTLLALGMYAVAVGAMLLALSWQNRGGEKIERAAGRLFLFAMGVLIVMASIILTEESYPNAQHTGKFYIICSVTYAFYLTLASRASRSRWGATWSATAYMAMVLLMVWGLPLFQSRPLLAPIYIQVDHMVPPVFPFLLIVPAIVMDLVHQRLGKERNFWRDSLLAIALGVTFLAIFIAVQWNFSAFLLKNPDAKNWFFAAGEQWPYFIRPGPWRNEFWNQRNEFLGVSSALIALAFAVGASRSGLALGTWMSKVRR